jgi:hypothetical protein
MVQATCTTCHMRELSAIAVEWDSVRGGLDDSARPVIALTISALTAVDQGIEGRD